MLNTGQQGRGGHRQSNFTSEQHVWHELHGQQPKYEKLPGGSQMPPQNGPQLGTAGPLKAARSTMELMDAFTSTSGPALVKWNASRDRLDVNVLQNSGQSLPTRKARSAANGRRQSRHKVKTSQRLMSDH